GEKCLLLFWTGVEQCTQVSSTVLIGVEHDPGVEHSPDRRRARLNVEHSPHRRRAQPNCMLV
ncbi:hypothetical protein A2U01_0061645, partial [Trifolium medium]|nr:hypothetical protein [Trifolium medium]